MKVSVVIPTLGEEKTIGRCIKSINAQDYPDFEVIVADGNSNDKTRAIAKRLGVKVMIERKRTIAAGRQAGANAAKGEIIVFADADAHYPPNWLTELTKPFKDPKVVCAHGPAMLEDPTPTEKILNNALNQAFKLSNAVGNPTGPGSNLAVRKKTFNEVGGFDTNVVTGEDVLLQQKLVKKGKSVYAKNAVAYVSARRVRKWGYKKFFLFHAQNYLRTTLKKQPLKEYEHVR